MDEKDVVESVNHDIAVLVDRVTSQRGLDLVIFSFIKAVAMKHNRISVSNVRHEYLLMAMSDGEEMR